MEVVDFVVIVGILLLACIETGEIMVCDAAAAEAADMMENDASRQMMSIIILHNIEDMMIDERYRSGYYGDRKRVRGGRGSNQYYHSQQRRNRQPSWSQDIFSRCCEQKILFFPPNQGVDFYFEFLPAKIEESICI